MHSWQKHTQWNSHWDSYKVIFKHSLISEAAQSLNNNNNWVSLWAGSYFSIVSTQHSCVKINWDICKTSNNRVKSFFSSVYFLRFFFFFFTKLKQSLSIYKKPLKFILAPYQVLRLFKAVVPNHRYRSVSCLLPGRREWIHYYISVILTITLQKLLYLKNKQTNR